MVDYENDVEYKTDIKRPYQKLFKSAYEKCNIWPYEDGKTGKEILLEEIGEAVDDIAQIERWIIAQDNAEKGKRYTHHEVEKLKAITVSTIMELMQVLSVCNKYDNIWNNDAYKERCSNKK